MCLRSFNKGTTLVAMMVSLGISSLLMAGLAHFWASQYSHGLWLEEAAYLQEQGYSVKALLQQAIYQAGYSGCVGWSGRYPAASPIQILSPAKITGIHGESEGLQLHYWQAIPNTQVLTVKPYEIVVATPIDLSQIDSLLLHDCTQWQSLKIKHIRRFRDRVVLVLEQPLPLIWQQPQLARFCTEEWVIAKTKRVNRAGHAIFALFQRQDYQSWQEIVSDVYGLSIHNDKGMQIEFVLGSDRESQRDRRPIPFGHSYFYPTDNRWYQRWQLKV